MSPSERRPEPAAQVVDGDRAPAPESAPPVEGDGYRVFLEKFEGPLDLLLYLIKRDEVDIYDIPISRITDQYLASIDAIERLEVDLDRAGDYLLMAATLMRIKARMLVPRDEEDEGEEELDPRAELVRRLLEYREFKRVAETLRGREEEWREIFTRAGSFRPPDAETEDVGELGVTIVDLFREFRRMMEKIEVEDSLDMETEEYSVDERMDFIRGECAGENGVPFRRLFEGPPSRALLVTTFLGLLELMRLREILADQVGRFGEIWIRPRKEDVVAS